MSRKLMKIEGLSVLLEQDENKVTEWLKNKVATSRWSGPLGKVTAESNNCATCVDRGLHETRTYALNNEDGTNEQDANGIPWTEIYMKKGGDWIHFKTELDKIISLAILYDVDTEEPPMDSLSQEEKDKYLPLTSSEKTRLVDVCYILRTLVKYIKNINSNDAPKATKYWKKICAKFKVKYEKGEEESETPKVDAIIGCMDSKAKNYKSKYNTQGVGSCRYDVNLAKLKKYDISFYKPNKFTGDGRNKEVTITPKEEYGICVRERGYAMVDENNIFHGYQDETDIPLTGIEGDRLKFQGDVGFYGSPSNELISDVKIAITYYMHMVSKLNENDGDDCILAPIHMTDVIVEIKDDTGVNHGVIKFSGSLEPPTLRIKELGYTNWLNYRASNTKSFIDSKRNTLKLLNTDDGGHHAIDCEKWKNKKYYTSKSDFKCINTSNDGWITVGKTVSESKIGLGTLLGRKDKPITGLGGLLED